MGPGIVRFKGRRDSQRTSRRSSGAQARINVGRLAVAPIAGSIVREAKHREVGSGAVQWGDGRCFAGASHQSRSTSSGRPCSRASARAPTEAIDPTGQARLIDGDTIGVAAAPMHPFGVDARESARRCTVAPRGTSSTCVCIS